MLEKLHDYYTRSKMKIDKEYYFDENYLSEEDEVEVNVNKENSEIIPKKMFITHYQTLVQNSTLPNILNKWYNF